MILLTYEVTPDMVNTETDWLHDLRVYPTIKSVWNYQEGCFTSHFGMIVTPENATLIKLRHPLQLQQQYHQR